MLIQDNIRHMKPVIVLVPRRLKERSKIGHWHKCYFCEDQKIRCVDTFYVRRTGLGDFTICRTCAKLDDMKGLFPKLAAMLKIRDNHSHDPYAMKAYKEILNVGAVKGAK